MRITDFFIRRAQLRELGKNPQLITAVENPSEKMQLAAVRQNPDLVSVLDNPTEEVQLAAVRQKADCLLQLRDVSRQKRSVWPP